ncbi:hypothetical protein UlMin_020225 [Ulmus minor]
MASSKAHHDSEPGSIVENPDGTITFFPRGLNIVWGNDQRYWKIPGPGNERDNPAELIQVSWLEVTGSYDLKDKKKCTVEFDLSLKSDAFGWNGCQVYLMAKIGRKGKYKWTKVSLKDQTGSNRFTVPSNVLDRDSSSSNSDDKKLYFGLYEVWTGKWKGGLQIHKAIIKPVQ